MIGRTIGPYQVVAKLGEGGMGQVYRARDTRLGRDVALKTLPDSFTHAPERLARFRREAQMLASLNHPHIGAIYGLEEVDGQQVLVLEFVDGETLADRIARGPIPFEDAVVLATQIAEALEAAHEKGIIHRDLKPANIALTKEGAVKVLDFGLAKAADSSGAAQLDMPTLTSPALLTGQGVILGTAAYMSPEQAKGRTADKRSDAWAFGCVVYEMLTGRRPFGGDEVSDTLASVLRDEPDWRALPAAARPLASVLRRLLEKDPARRLRDMSDVKLLMTDAEQRSAPEVSVASRSRRWWIVGAAAVGVAVGVVSAALVLPWRGGATPAPRVERFALTSAAAPPSTEPNGRNIAISPDGSHVVYTTASSSSFQLVVRSIDQVDGTILAGTERGRDPFFSADGRQIGYATLDELRRVSVDGGSSISDLSHLGPVQRRELGPRRLHRLRTGGRTRIVSSPGRWRRTGTHRGAGRVEGRAQLPPSHGSSGRPLGAVHRGTERWTVPDRGATPRRRGRDYRGRVGVRRGVPGVRTPAVRAGSALDGRAVRRGHTADDRFTRASPGRRVDEAVERRRQCRRCR